MNKKLISLLVYLLMLVIVNPVIGLPIDAKDVCTSNYLELYHQAPSPGYAPILPSSALVAQQSIHEHPEKTVATMDTVIISMLEQVDETVYLNYLTNLTAFGPRLTGSNACTAAAAYIYNQFESMGLAVRYHYWNNGVNVEATINGTNESSNEIYIICGHYDTVDPSPGADDDASGTVAVLVAAYIMSNYEYKFNHTIKFVTFSGEEQGLLGSKAYASEAHQNGWNIIGVLNADMISYAITASDGQHLVVYVNDASKWLYDYTVDISNEYANYIDLTLVNGGINTRSDHYYFWIQGYSAIFYFEYSIIPYYHTAEDTIAHINATYAVKNIRLMLATLAELSEVRYVPNQPPVTPDLTGPSQGKINQKYTYFIYTTEPENQDLYYFIQWGDGQVDEWVGPYQSKQIIEITHKWSEEGNYTIRAKAKDIHNAESDWATLTVTMPYPYNPMHQFLERLLERFPHAFPALRRLLG